MINFEGMRRAMKLWIAGLGLFLGACSLPEQEIRVFSVSYIFNNSEEGWVGDFADYPEGDSIAYELLVKRDTIPGDSTKKGLLISGKNESDDLFMFIKRKITGLRPNTTYALLFNVKVSSNAPTGAVGIGGAPGESVFVK